MDQHVGVCPGPSGSEIAYAVTGTGPPLVFAAWWTSHLELDWQNPSFRDFVEALSSNHTVIRYDRSGVGMSTRAARPFDLETETASLASVADAAGCDEFDILAISCGGPPAVRLAASWPDRVRRLVAFGSYLDGASISDRETQDALVALVAANWGIGSQTLSGIFLPDADAPTVRRFTAAQRDATSAPVAAALLALTFRMSAIENASAVRQPTLVLHRENDHTIGLVNGHALADSIPSARLAVLEGRDHLPWHGDMSAVLGEIEAFLIGASALPPPTRQLSTVCVVEVIDGGALVAEIGDARWRERLDNLRRVVADEAASLGGEILHDTGEQVVLIFGLPGESIVFAAAVRDRTRSFGLEIGVGIHAGEIAVRGTDISGRTLAVARALAACSGPARILVSTTTADLAEGRGLRFDVVDDVPVESTGDRVLVCEAEPVDRASVRNGPDTPGFDRHGDIWELSFAGRSGSVRHAKGVADLALLVARPGVEVDVVELMDGAPLTRRSTGSDALDADAIRAYRDRLGTIERALDAADLAGDAVGSIALTDERDQILRELRGAVGLGGRVRRIGDDVERARKAVTGRVRDAIGKIAAVHPLLGAHLREEITTGRICRYR